MNKKRRTGSEKNQNAIISLNVASTIILQGLTFFTTPIFSGILGAENYGITSLCYTWAIIAATIFGLKTESTLSVARIELLENQYIRYQSSVLSLSVLFLAIFMTGTAVFSNYLAELLSLPVILIYLIAIQAYGIFCTNFINAKFVCEFKAGKNLFVSVGFSLFNIILSYILIQITPSDINYLGRVLGQAIAYLLFALGVCTVVFKKGKLFVNKEYWKYCLPLALPMVFHSLSNILLSHSDKVMLQMITSKADVGIYSLACSFSAVLSTIWNALNNSWVAFYYEFTKEKLYREIKKKAQNYIELFTVLAIGFVLLETEVFHIYANHVYWTGANLIPILAVGYYLVFMYSFPVNFEFYYKRSKTIAAGTIGAAVCNILLNYFMIKQWGMSGAAWATMIAHGLQFGFHHIISRYVIKKDYLFDLGMFAPYFIIFFAVAILCSYDAISWKLRWGTGILLGVFEIGRMIKRRSIF
ncbi:hypothetical protein D3Z50_06110 [Clostridiaceae bacterium]|nr:hypothetical protein [Clostridiaceae bacterium]